MLLHCKAFFNHTNYNGLKLILLCGVTFKDELNCYQERNEIIKHSVNFIMNSLEVS